MDQYIREKSIGMALVSAPNKIPRGNWIGDSNGDAAVWWEASEKCTLVRRGQGFVLVKSRG